MKRLLIAGAMMAVMIVPQTQVWADDEELTTAQQEAVKKEVQRILREQGYTGGGMTKIDPPSTDLSKSGRSLKDLSQPRQLKKKYSSTMQGSGSLIFAKPFVASPKAILGGYADIEYINRKNDGTPSTFDQHRFVPFIYGDISDRVKFAAEIEFEHTGRGGLEPGATNGLEVAIEFMTIDYLIIEPINLRAGVILLPLGKFNLLHDAPLRDLTERPMVTETIIPAALRQAGAGAYGTFYPTQLSKLDYEVYVTNGFTKDSVTGSSGVKGARFGGDDNNDGKSVVGRVAFSPLLGIEIGGSGFYGMYNSSGTRDKSLTIAAVDWTFLRGPFELIGESAWAWAPDNAPIGSTPGPTVVPEDMFGYYVQFNYHFLPRILTSLAPTFFRPEVSTLTAVLRWEMIDLNQDVDGNFTGARERERLTAGLNFRPLEDSVFKLDLQYSPKEIGKSGGATVPVHDTAFLASWATYF